MRDDLIASSGRFARSGLRALLEKDWDVFVLHSGTALEHLCKAYLAGFHPSLIAKQDHLDSLMHACGIPSPTGRTLGAMRTIGVQQALDWSCELLRELRPFKESVKL